MHLSTWSGHCVRKIRVETFHCWFIWEFVFSLTEISFACKCIKTWIRCHCGLESVWIFPRRVIYVCFKSPQKLVSVQILKEFYLYIYQQLVALALYTFQSRCWICWKLFANFLKTEKCVYSCCHIPLNNYESCWEIVVLIHQESEKNQKLCSVWVDVCVTLWVCVRVHWLIGSVLILPACFTLIE